MKTIRILHTRLAFASLFLSLVLLFELFANPLRAGSDDKPVVLITGASRGIGLATARLLAREGYVVYAGHRPTSCREQLEIAARECPDGFRPIPVDVTDSTSVDELIARVLAETGKIDVLVNNAGVLLYGSIENCTLEEAHALFETNFFGVVRLCQAVLPSMRQAGRGKIIQISSRSGFRPLPSLSLYAASKFALEGLSETMAVLLRPWNITVSLIEPGPVDTDMDSNSPYGSRLAVENDPFHEMFNQAGLLIPASDPQPAEEIALFVKWALEDPEPKFRYQTTPAIEQQAALRLVDPSGLTSLREWDPLFHALGDGA